MRKLLIVIVVLIIGFALWFFMFKKSDGPIDPKQEPLKTTVNSAIINKSVGEMVRSYLTMKNAFIEADTAAIKSAAKGFLGKVDSVKLDELKKDSVIYQSAEIQIVDLQGNATAIIGEKDLTEMRKGLQMVSESLYPLLKTVGYKGEKLYWQNCPMAFGEGKDASWISNSEEIMNPYMGKKHPEFKSGMLHCGETKDSIDGK
jgi:hypothetical protein